MRIGEHDLSKRRTRLYWLQRGDGAPFSVLLSSWPMGAVAAAQRLFPAPRPPSTLVFDARNIAKRDAAGELIHEPNTNDPEYLRAFEEAARRRTIYLLALGLRDDQNVVFDAPQPKKDAAADEWARYCDAVYAELLASNFTEDEIADMIRIVRELGLPSLERIEKKREGFLPEDGAANPGASPTITSSGPTST